MLCYLWGKPCIAKLQDIMSIENYIKAVSMLSDLSNKIDESFKNTNENILESSKKFLSFLRDSKSSSSPSTTPSSVALVAKAAASLTGNPIIEKAVDMVTDNSVYFSDMADIAPPAVPVKKSIIDHENDILKQLFRDVYSALYTLKCKDEEANLKINAIQQLMYDTLNKK
jgi:hypothetical protein